MKTGIIKILKNYLDLREDYYPIVAIWIIGTYLHKQFQSFPYLFFNAMKGSGKTRTLGLISWLQKNGALQKSHGYDVQVIRTCVLPKTERDLHRTP
ncbi:hypothetical protein LCGC14_2712680 [marine sediment metagenome]|uniref:Uncharacterized protein n=1 Tax=marine sediment metagenome TaxID=412755 RepID=A0A0F9C489_9ZZZZ